MTANTRHNGLPNIHRFITTHNESGEAIFSDAVPAEAKWDDIGKTSAFNFFLGYTTSKFPASMKPSDEKDEKSEPEDIVSYKEHLDNPPGLCISSGRKSNFAQVQNQR